METIKNIKYLIIFPIVIFGITAFNSCKKFVEVEPPFDLVIASAVFNDDKTATSAVLGLYSQMMNINLYLINGGATVYSGLSSDEITNSLSNTNIDPFTSNSIPSNSTVIQTNLWRYGYSYIYQANACIEGLQGNSKISLPLRNQLIGEAKFIRALNNFYLVNFFGDIPIALSTDYRINENMPRKSMPEVYTQIISDLKDAESLLLPQYPTGMPTRVNKYAASALLARVYLYQRDWALAELKSTEVINSGVYDLVKPLSSVFLAGSKEAILQLAPVNTFNTAEGATFIPSSGTVRPAYVLTPGLVGAFEKDDLRKADWVKANSVSGNQYSFPYKYKIRSGANKTEYNMMLRLSEQYLIRAEARIQQDKISQGIQDLNKLRERARPEATPNNPNPLPDLTLEQTKIPALFAVEQERRVELFCEGGHRWFDLKRTGRIDSVLSVVKPFWNSNAASYPIPFAELQKNSSLIQNAGYQ